MSHPATTENDVLFWNFVDTDEDGNDCWNWCGSTIKRNDGTLVGDLRRGKKHFYAPRWAWKLYTGKLPSSELVVMHACDNPLCVRWDHLHLGTKADNSRDMVEKNRSAYGERHSQATLTRNDVEKIRSLYLGREKG